MQAIKVLLFFLCLSCSILQALPRLDDFEKIVESKRAKVGLAVLCEGEEPVLLNNKVRYPLMSVFKLHVAVSAMDKMRREKISLDKMIFVKACDMQKDTFSPLLKRYPNCDFEISLKELLEAALALSDNNACDILIKFTGGIEKIDAYIRSLGIDDFKLSETEASMNADIAKSYNNYSSPLSLVALLKKIYTKEGILSPEHLAFLKDTLASSNTGADKLRAGLPPNARLEHKTGHSARTKSGLRIAENDAGVFYLPDGRRCYIAVFVKDSLESDSDNAKIIADIAKLSYESLLE